MPRYFTPTLYIIPAPLPTNSLVLPQTLLIPIPLCHPFVIPLDDYLLTLIKPCKIRCFRTFDILLLLSRGINNIVSLKWFQLKIINNSCCTMAMVKVS